MNTIISDSKSSIINLIKTNNIYAIKLLLENNIIYIEDFTRIFEWDKLKIGRFQGGFGIVFLR